MRLFIETSFIFTLSGQFILGIAASFIASVQLQFCVNWFCSKIRPLFISLLIIMGTIGIGVGNVIPLFFVDNDENDVTVLIGQFSKYNFYMFYFSLGVTVAMIILFRGKPPRGFGYSYEKKQKWSSQSQFSK
jgi:hypothetical protein